MRNRPSRRSRAPAGRRLPSGAALAAWTPAALPGYLDSPYSIAALRAAGALWQNAAKTVPAVAASDPVRVVDCGSLDYVAPSDAARPLLANPAGSSWALDFNGTSHTMSGLVTASQEFWVWCEATFDTVAGTVRRLFDSTDRALFGATNTGPAWQLFAGTLISSGTPAAGTKYTLAARFNGASSSLSADGAAVVSGDVGVSGTGGTVFLGADNLGAAFFDGLLYGLSVVTGALSAGDQARLASYYGGL